MADRDKINATTLAVFGPRETWMDPGATIVACISGGKDSTALALLLEKERPAFLGDRKVVYIHNDTGWENPVTVAYVDYLASVIGQPIVKVPSKYTFESLVLSRRMFPSPQRRFCTQELKVFPAARWMIEQGLLNAVITRGVRADESKPRAEQPEWGDKTTALKHTWPVWQPLMEWSADDVFAIHARHNVEPNPLYRQGFTRVGCWPCIMANKKQLRMMFSQDPWLLLSLRNLENRVNREAAENAKANGKQPTARPFFCTDKIPARLHTGRSVDSEGEPLTYPTIDDIFDWCMADKADDPEPDEGGCVSSFGLCE